MMKNIPVFTTSHGIATLILREIPFNARAYILPQSVFTTQQRLLYECADFCRAAGAQQVFACLDRAVQGAAFHCQIWELCRSGTLPTAQREVSLIPLSTGNMASYLTLYNERFRNVDYAAHCDQRAATLAQTEGGWLWQENGVTLGLGQAWNGELRAIATSRPGLGYDLALALMRTLDTDEVRLTVASTNTPALRLYERLGFEKVAVRSQWYQI